jgi:hypothetical protein
MLTLFLHRICDQYLIYYVTLVISRISTTYLEIRILDENLHVVGNSYVTIITIVTLSPLHK